MASESPHPDALDNCEDAYIPEAKIQYVLQHSSKGRVFAALGYGEEVGNQEALRKALLESLPRYPATLDKEDAYGVTYEVTIPLRGPGGKVAPVRTYWIREWGDEAPRLTTMYINTRQWSRWEQRNNTSDGA